MTISNLPINIGGQPNDGTGDSIRAAFDKVNQNFTNLFAAYANILNPTVSLANHGNVTNVSEIDITGLDFSNYYYDLEISASIIGGGYNGWITVQLGDSSTPTNWDTTSSVSSYGYGNAGGSNNSYTTTGTFGIATTRSPSISHVLGTARLRADATGGTGGVLVQWAGAFSETGGTYDTTTNYKIGALKIGSTMGNFSGSYALYAIARS